MHFVFSSQGKPLFLFGTQNVQSPLCSGRQPLKKQENHLDIPCFGLTIHQDCGCAAAPAIVGGLLERPWRRFFIGARYGEGNP
jgi:hypothetical protein